MEGNVNWIPLIQVDRVVIWAANLHGYPATSAISFERELWRLERPFFRKKDTLEEKFDTNLILAYIGYRTENDR